MTRTQHLLVILMKDATKVAQRVSKALLFGVEEVQPGQTLTNGERVTMGFIDLLAAFEMAAEDGAVPFVHQPAFQENVAIIAKREKVEVFLKFSSARGLVDGETPEPDYPHPEK